MKIVFFAGEFPYPPVYGGIADAWNRIKALSSLGQEILLVSWVRDDKETWPSVASIEIVKKYVVDNLILTFDSSISRQLQRFLLLPAKPICVSAREMPKEGFGELDRKMANFKPDIIWVDNFTISSLAKKYAKKYSCPQVMRSHNIEHIYQNSVIAAERTTIKRLKSKIQIFGLKRVEIQALNSADMFFDISLDDLSFWQQRGVGRGEWLPPIIENRADVLAGAALQASEKCDVAYLGSLKLSTNISGLVWFYESVVPVLRAKKLDFSILIGGSSPTPDVIRLIESDQYSVLKANVADPNEVWSAGRVLMNPVLEGSGMNVKSAEMLFHPQALIGTPLAVRGMPPGAKSQFMIGETPEKFANCILMALSGDFQRKGVDEARALFDYRRVEKLIETLSGLCKARSALHRSPAEHSQC